MKKAGILLSTILDLAKAMIVTGADTWQVEEAICDLFDTYCSRRTTFLSRPTASMLQSRPGTGGSTQRFAESTVRPATLANSRSFFRLYVRSAISL